MLAYFVEFFLNFYDSVTISPTRFLTISVILTVSCTMIVVIVDCGASDCWQSDMKYVARSEGMAMRLFAKVTLAAVAISGVTVATSPAEAQSVYWRRYSHDFNRWEGRVYSRKSDCEFMLTEGWNEECLRVPPPKSKKSSKKSRPKRK